MPALRYGPGVTPGSTGRVRLEGAAALIWSNLSAPAPRGTGRGTASGRFGGVSVREAAEALRAPPRPPTGCCPSGLCRARPAHPPGAAPARLSSLPAAPPCPRLRTAPSSLRRCRRKMVSEAGPPFAIRRHPRRGRRAQPSERSRGSLEPGPGVRRPPEPAPAPRCAVTAARPAGLPGGGGLGEGNGSRGGGHRGRSSPCHCGPAPGRTGSARAWRPHGCPKCPGRSWGPQLMHR